MARLSTILGTIVANPLNIYFLRRRQVQAKFSTFLKPFGIFFALYLPYRFLLPDVNWPLKIAAFLIYFILSFVLSVFTMEDIKAISEEVNSLFKKRFQA